MKNWIKKVIRWIKDLFQSGKLRKSLETTITELETLRAAVIDFTERIDNYEVKITKYKKQIKELKAALKEFTQETTSDTSTEPAE